MSTIDTLSKDLKKLIVEYAIQHYIYSVYIGENNSDITYLVCCFSSLEKALNLVESKSMTFRDGYYFYDIKWGRDLKHKYYKFIVKSELDNPMDEIKKYTTKPSD